MNQMPQQLAEQVWKVGGQIEWSVEDWTDFYHSLTAFFARVCARHAKKKIEGQQ